MRSEVNGTAVVQLTQNTGVAVDFSPLGKMIDMAPCRSLGLVTNGVAPAAWDVDLQNSTGLAWAIYST